MAVSTDYTANANTAPSDSPNVKAGKLTMAGSLTAGNYIVLHVGFTPRFVCFENATDRTRVEWFEGMADDTCIKTAAAGTRTLETTNKGITVCDVNGTASATGRYIAIAQNATLAAVTASDVCYWHAIG